MKSFKMNENNASKVAELMATIRPQWWSSYDDAYGQLTDIHESIGTVGWYLGEDENHPRGWILCRELKGFSTIELECSGYNDNGIFKLEHKLKELFEVASEYARSKGYSTFRTGMSSHDFNIHGKPIDSVPKAIENLQSDRIDYKWLLDYGFRVIGIQPNAYEKNYHLIIFAKEL